MKLQQDIKFYKKQILYFIDDFEQLKQRYDFSEYHFTEFGGIINDYLDDLIEKLEPYSY